MTQKIAGQIVFGLSIIPPTQIFLMRKNVYAMINHKPFVPGHVLVCSRRQVPKLQDLTEIQCIDLFMTAHQITKKLQQIYKTQYQIFMQNGKDAGQTVPHVHLHLIPAAKSNLNAGLQRRQDLKRSQEDMAKQADIYRSCFQQSSN